MADLSTRLASIQAALNRPFIQQAVEQGFQPNLTSHAFPPGTVTAPLTPYPKTVEEIDVSSATMTSSTSMAPSTHVITSNSDAGGLMTGAIGLLPPPSIPSTDIPISPEVVPPSFDHEKLPPSLGQKYPDGMGGYSSEILDRLQGSLLGLLVGNAYGAPLSAYQSNELYTNPSLRSSLTPRLPSFPASGYGDMRHVVGQLSIDGELTLETFREIITNAGFNEESYVLMLQRWVATLPKGKWLRNDTFVKLFNTSKGYADYLSKYGYFFNATRNSDAFPAGWSWPLIFIRDAIPSFLAVFPCDNSVMQLVYLYIDLLRTIIRGETREKILQDLRDAVEQNTYNELTSPLSMALHGHPRNVSSSEIYSSRQAAYILVYAFAHFTEISPAIFWATTQSNGTNSIDADLMGAMVGAVFGAWQGYKNLLCEDDFAANLWTLLTANPNLGTLGDRPVLPMSAFEFLESFVSTPLHLTITPISNEQKQQIHQTNAQRREKGQYQQSRGRGRGRGLSQQVVSRGTGFESPTTYSNPSTSTGWSTGSQFPANPTMPSYLSESSAYTSAYSSTDVANRGIIAAATQL